MRRLLLAALLAVAGCSSSSSSASIKISKPPYSLAQLTAARAQARAHPCAERPGHQCGLLFATGHGDLYGSCETYDAWIGAVVRNDGSVVLLGAGHRLSDEAAQLQFLPGMRLEWDGTDCAVNPGEIREQR